MNSFDKQYIGLCQKILKTGESITNYSSTDNRSQASHSVIPNHTAQANSAAKTIRLPHRLLLTTSTGSKNVMFISGMNGR